jgi:hypothetical protein
MSTDLNNPSPEASGYLLLFRGTNWDHTALSTEEMREVMERVTAWFDGLSREGKVAAGQPLLDGARVISGRDGRVVTDGPFPETKEAIGGYLLLTVKSMEEAEAVARSNPLLDYGVSVELRETASSCPVFHRVQQLLAHATP